MAAPTRRDNTAYLYFTGSFDSASGVANLFISGTANATSGAMPLFLQAKEEKSSTLSLYLASIAKTSSWESLGNPWQSYSVQCSLGAPSYCQDWEYIPYNGSQASGIQSSVTLFASGAHRGNGLGAMPLFLYSSGNGLSFDEIPLFLYAQNNEYISSGSITMAMSGHTNINSNIPITIFGQNPSASGSITIFCQSYGDAYETIKLFVSGI
jgi:hypothetical protein